MAFNQFFVGRYFSNIIQVTVGFNQFPFIVTIGNCIGEPFN
jgi:hypothetical protein